MDAKEQLLANIARLTAVRVYDAELGRLVQLLQPDMVDANGDVLTQAAVEKAMKYLLSMPNGLGKL